MPDGFGHFIVGIKDNAGRRTENGLGETIGDTEKRDK
jgi:hypothetical protein